MNEHILAGAAQPAPAAERPGRKPRRRPSWLLPAGLLTLGVLPILANVLRRIALATGADDAVAAPPMPLPVILHLIGATVFVLLGALQFSPGLRRRRPAWHRIAGRIVILAGLLAALSGIWLALSFAPHTGTAVLLFTFRLLAATGMLLSILLAYGAIRRRRDIRTHRAWMIRAFALGLGAATQIFTLGFGQALFGTTELSTALLNGAGWALNLAVAELAIRGGLRLPARPASPRAARS